MSKKLAIQGERGSFAHEAALVFGGRSARIGFYPSLAELWAAIENQKADLAVLPVENSLIGKVSRTGQFLKGVSWQTVDSLLLPVCHSLIACPGARLETIKTVESHPAALAQCRKFFRARPGFRAINGENTAASARSVIESGDPTRAAIAAAKTAEIFGGKVLLENIQDETENHTKFLLLKK